MSAYEFSVSGDPAVARQTVVEALEAHQFVLHWEHDWVGRAIRGSKSRAALLGAFAPYMEVGLRVMALDGGITMVRLDQMTTGWFSGVIGVARTDKAFVAVRDQLARTFDAAGVLVGHRNPAASIVIDDEPPA